MEKRVSVSVSSRLLTCQHEMNMDLTALSEHLSNLSIMDRDEAEEKRTGRTRRKTSDPRSIGPAV